MNKKTIDAYLPKAYKLLSDSCVAENNEMPKMFRGYISSFGAAITMGSLKAAVAAYSAQGGAKNPRENLVKIIYALICEKEYKDVGNKDLYDYVVELNDDKMAKEKILNAAIAVKLAMNMYVLK